MKVSNSSKFDEFIRGAVITIKKVKLLTIEF